jgi:purine-binding chemotaxis protein CheW
MSAPTQAANPRDDSSGDIDADLVDAAGQDRQFVTFEVAGELFAVPMTMVQEIIRVPAVAHLPLAPGSLAGLANLRGRVLPVVHLRRLFNAGDVQAEDANRVLVIHLGQSIGFMVDRVASVVSVPPEAIEATDTLQSIVSADYLAGAIRHQSIGEGRVVPLVDFTRLAEVEFKHLKRSSASSAATLAGAAAEAGETVDDALRLVSFAVAGQEYAIDIADVREIVQRPERITVLPNTPAHVMGVMSLRSRLLPLVSLRALFGLPAVDADERHRVVVVSQPGGAQVGLVTDAVREVMSVPRAEADAMPALLAQDDCMREFASICRIEGGKRLVSVIATARLFGMKEIAVAVDAAAAAGDTLPGDDGAEGAGGDEDTTQVVVFRLGDGEFGVPIAGVQEIVRVPETLTGLPGTPAYVAGVINLRGGVLPVLDQRNRFGLAAVERTDSQRIMVHLHEGVRTGFVVDAVAEVLRIPLADVEPAPALAEGGSALVSHIAKLEAAGRMIMLIEASHAPLVRRDGVPVPAPAAIEAPSRVPLAQAA